MITPVIFIAKDTWILEDAQKKYAISDVLSEPLLGAFVKNNKNYINQNLTHSSWWFRYEIPVEKLDQTKKYFLMIDYPRIDEIEIYFLEGSQVKQHYLTGDRFPFYQRPIENPDFHFGIPALNKKPLTLLIRANSTQAMLLPARIAVESFYENDIRTVSILQGIFLGIATSIAFLVLFLFMQFKEIVYIYYLTYTIFLAMLIMSLSGMAYQYLWPDFPGWNNLSVFVLPSYMVWFIILFLKEFFSIKKKYPLINKVYNGIFAIIIVKIVISLVTDNMVFQSTFQAITGTIYMLIFFPFTLAAFIQEIRQGSKTAKYILAAWCIFFLAASLIVLQTFNILESSAILRNSLHIGGALEMIFFTMALIQKFHDTFVERNQARENLVNEKYRIARELHDSFGSTINNFTLVLEQSRLPAEVIQNLLIPIKKIYLQIKDTIWMLNSQNQNSDVIGKEILEYIENLRQTKRFQVFTDTLEIPGFLPHYILLQLRGIFLEWMTNVVRHSKPDIIHIQIKHSRNQRLVLVIVDNGTGISYRFLDSGKNKSEAGHYGLHNICFRTTAAKGRARALKWKDKNIFILRIPVSGRIEP
ncbi:MAG: hypothetical protein OEV66_09610 [Spirochaetia bacterium]|nr:hypothetical protein [Spirochaetia bacterium]